MLEAEHFAHVQLGMPILMDIKGMHHLQSVLIGAKPGHYLILAMPSVEALGHTLERAVFKKGNQVVARYLHEGVAVGFEAQIIGVVQEPDRLVFISCPKVVTQKSLRRQLRVHCLLPARLRVGEHTIEGVIKDISQGGCRFTTPALAMAKVLSDNMAGPVSVTLSLPGIEGEIEVQGEQRSFMNDGEALAVGIRFVGMEENAKEKLAHWIERLIKVTSVGSG